MKMGGAYFTLRAVFERKWRSFRKKDLSRKCFIIYNTGNKCTNKMLIVISAWGIPLNKAQHLEQRLTRLMLFTAKLNWPWYLISQWTKILITKNTFQCFECNKQGCVVCSVCYNLCDHLISHRCDASNFDTGVNLFYLLF